ncbi:hypothetical protein AAIR29_10275 [Psychrobacter sp. FBL11]|uniref:5-methylcytosine-specific restriction enzyme subunit McrC n=1 Tax=Psychrobacter saeujeotis TaxID=3143436 RepID=A0ABU9XA04_9GAMM|nr:hypothetical protein [uncultured Psychrobacter sp.]
MSVFEHQRLVAEDFIDVDDFAWLLAQEFAVFSIKRQRGQWQLKVGHYIGIVLLPSGITLEILPKAAAIMQKNSLNQSDEIIRTRQWVQMMLADLMVLSSRHHRLPHTKTLGQLSQYLTPLPTQTPPLSQWLISQFLQLLSSYQPTKQYQTQSHNQSMLQGKLLIKEQLKHNSHQPHKFVCEVDQLSVDMLANRLIKSALVFLEQLAGTSQVDHPQSISLSAALLSKLVYWRQITELSHYEQQRLSPLYQRAKQQLTTQPLSRLQRQSVHKLLDLAYWLLQMQYSTMPTGNGVGHKGGQMRLCLLINMNQAFEQWASLRLTQLFEQSTSINQPSYQTFTQQKDIWLRDTTGQTCLSIQPDLLVYDTACEINSQRQRTDQANAVSHCSHVIDIKWKPLTHARDISATDAYQLTSYAQAYQAKQVWLVYPVMDDTTQPVALQQSIDSVESNHALLWLMPFNVTTGMLNKTALSE